MLGEPSTKRVRRAEAFTSSRSASPSRCPSPTSASENNGIPDPSLPGLVFEYEETEIPDLHQHELVSTNEPEEETFEFRLFATKPAAAIHGAESHEHGATRINIRSPTPLSAQGEGGFVVPSRPLEYYFTRPGNGEEEERRRREFGEVALAGEDVLSRARSTAWPGAALPWRVIRLPASSLARSLKRTPSSLEVEESGLKRRGRAGKKRRRAIRKKHVVEVRAIETEKEKRARKNREKKLKKREKNRKMKQLQANKDPEQVSR